MKKMIKSLANKAICAVFVVLGAMSVCAEGVREDLKDDNGNVVGYKVTGLGNDQNETAVVFTKITGSGETIPWTVPYDLENVQFLVVGGGGGGGGSSGDAAGAGGGGGAVITGVVSFEENDRIDVKIGKGGAGGFKTSSTTNGAAAAGTDTGATYFKVNDVDCVRALWGGRDVGRNKVGGKGGSNAGNRGKVTTAQTFTLDDRDGDINTTLVKSYTSYAHKGGLGHSGSIRPAAGGGGATQDGGSVNQTKENSKTTYTAGKGGDGFTSSITGEEKVYGSGGGGGTTVYDNSAYSYFAGKGGAGAGDGATNGNGGDGLANQGGGGGGGADGNGGDGGSGIIVFRYKAVAEKPVVDNLTYTGSELVGVSGNGFTVVSGTVAATEVGTYTAVLSPEGVWADGTTGDYEVTWKISPRMPNASNVAAGDGYIVRGLGNGNEVAVVFTNENAEVVNWSAPITLNNVQFLVVGGGGGGGADFNITSKESPFQGGAGGGGGGVVVGTMPLDASDDISITVGAGGIGGLNSDNSAPYGNASSGSASKVKIGEEDYIIAYGGGGDGGSNDDHAKTGNVGQSGGSSAGSRPGQTTVGEITPSFIHNDIVETSSSYGHKGGAGYYVANPSNDNSWWGFVAAAGGGGGATSVGGSAVSSSNPGNGGTGFTSDITGESLVYGSGGGGGTISGATDVIAGKGGSGAGDGAIGGNAGGNAIANQGGGGGGARKTSGGNGGSGIVVFRFEYNEVAAVNGYGYADIAEAINAANGGTVTLVANIESITLNNSLTLKTDVYSVNAVTLANENAVLTTDKKLNVISSVEDYEVVETVEDGVYIYSLEVVISTYTITLPEVPGAKWYYGKSAVVGNTITVESGTDVTLTLKADSGYVFENGEASITVNIGNVTADVVVNDSQYVAPSEKQPSGKIDSFKTLNTARKGFDLELVSVYAKESLIFRVFDAEDNLLTETRFQKPDRPIQAGTCNVVIDGELSSSWSTEIKTEKLTVENLPAKVELWADGVLVHTYNKGLKDPDVYCRLDKVYKEAENDSKLYASLNSAIESAEVNSTITLLSDTEAEVELNKSIVLVINDGVSYAGTITLTDAAVTLTAPEGLNVVTTLENYAVAYNDGVYTLVEDGDPIVESGIWGGIDWTLTAKGVLTIAPTAGEPTQIANRPKTFVRGEWPEAVRYNTKGEGVEIAGWPYDRSKVKKLVIEEGVTKIGSFTAQGFNNLTGEVVIPWTVTYIGQEAFQRSQFTKLTFGKVPAGKEDEAKELCIAQGAFKNLEIEEATLPDDRPVHLHAWIFNNCHKLKRVSFPATIKSMHGTNHIDYFKNFESHSNPTWTKSSELLAYDESIEVVTFGSEEVKNMFFNINNGTSKDYIKAVVGLKAYGKLQLAIDAANAGDTIKLIKDITENVTVNKPINFTGKTIKGEITIDPESNLIVKRDANGKIIGVVVPEAEMNSVKYAPVQEAIDAAQDGAVITLIADVTLTEPLKVDEGKTIILDLNGHNITMDESLAATGYAIENSGTLTLIDSGMDSGSVQSRGILNNGTLYVENGTYNAVGDGSAIVNNGEAYLTGGTFTAESGYSLNNASGATMSIGSRMRRMFAGVVVANGIYSNGDLLINGGEIYDNSGRNAICVDGDNAANSSAVINGGTITGGLSVNEGAGLEIAGGVFNGDKNQNYDIKGNISIKGGAFLDDAAKSFAHDNVTLKDNEVLTVTDEVFANLLRSKKGYYVSQNANYSYSIMLKSSFRLFVTAVEGKPRLGFFQDHAAGAKPCTLLGATNLEKPDWTPVAYSEANDASNASDHPLKWVKINETKDATKVYRFFKIAE